MSAMISEIRISYSVLSEIILEKQQLSEYIKSKYDLSDSAYKQIKVKVDRFITSHNIKLKKECYGNLSMFQRKNQSWLNQELVLFGDQQQSTPKVVKAFELCSERTKRKRCQDVRESIGEAEIRQVFLGNLRKNNQGTDLKIIELLGQASPSKKQKVVEILENGSKAIPVPYSADEALALMTDGKLSKFQYIQFQSGAKSRNVNLYPPYHQVLEAKKKCYPPKESIHISENGVNIDLQALVDHTATRLLEALKLDISKGEKHLKFIYKWGLDGASGQAQYKQIFNTKGIDDSSILMISLVPLQIQTESSIVLWTNPEASSTKYCRPIKFEFTKETEKTVKEQYKFIKDQIKRLQPLSSTINGTNFRVKHELNMTMVDGKVLDYLTDTSFTNCNVCGAKPSQMNNLKVLEELVCNEEVYEFGLSTLHCWIRFFECLLHIAYRLNLTTKKWRVVDKKDKEVLQETKKDIQDAFQEQRGLLVDMVKAGPGNTNDGNTARRFFKEPKLAAEVTGLDEKLIKRFGTIVTAICSGRDIDPDKFEEYALKTADVYFESYSWYYMPPAVHKVLFHGRKIISSLNLPIGLYSEEAQEARNKDFRRIRQNNTRKMNRALTNEDLIHGLLVSSDPYISSLRATFKKKSLPFDAEVSQLFK